MIDPSWSRKLSYQCLIFYNMEDLQNLYKLYQDKYIVYTQVRIYILTLASLSRTYLIRTILWWYIPHIMIYKIEKKNPRWKTNMCVTIPSGIIQCLHLFLTATSINSNLSINYIFILIQFVKILKVFHVVEDKTLIR
jgi:hypothetical protein